jgi:hypothetical protein
VFDSPNWKYISSTFSSQYVQLNGGHQWLNAASGTAGANVSYTQAMTLDANGYLLINTAGNIFGSAGRGLIEINGSANGLLGFKVGDVAKGYIQQTTSDLTAMNQASGSLILGTNNTSRWSVSSTGNLLAVADNTYDIGASGASRPRNIYISDTLVSGAVRVSAASAGVASTTTFGNGTATTVGATGAAAALPANPLGYIIAHVGTTQVKIPYYTA